MRNLYLLGFFFIFCIYNYQVSAKEYTLKCKSGWFNSFMIIKKKNGFFVDGVKYPNYSEKINSAGFLWGTDRKVSENINKLELLIYTKNIKNNYISKIQFLIIDLKKLTFVRGVDKKRRSRLSEKIYDWFKSSSGNCIRTKLS